MPWIKDDNGDDKFIPCSYTKDELPTWSELYNDFYINKVYKYSVDDDNQSQDMYWRIPYNKYLVGMSCNQFNKMIFDDNRKNELIIELNKNNRFDDLGKITNIKFILYDMNSTNKFKSSGIPYIYNISKIDGSEDIFIINNIERKDLRYMEDAILCPVLEYDSDTVKVLFPTDKNNNDYYEYIIDLMMKDVKEYFENGIGWKNKE